MGVLSELFSAVLYTTVVLNYMHMSTEQYLQVERRAFWFTFSFFLHVFLLF